MVWLHPALASERLEDLRFWALRAAEQSREYGEPEAVWAGYVDVADRASDLLDRRAVCGHSGRFPGCAGMRLRAPSESRKRVGCFFPLCLLSGKTSGPGRLRFHFNKEEH